MKVADLSAFAVNTDSCNLLKLLYSKTSKKTQESDPNICVSSV